jgi:hypothetical protein
MIVEFISTPGAGKTTLLPVVREHFNRLGYSAATVVEAARPFAGRTELGKTVNRLAPPALQRPLLWQVFYYYSRLHRSRFQAAHPDLTQTVLDFQRRRPISRPDRRHVLHWYEHLTGSYAFLKSHFRPEDVLLLDEGFVHRVVQLFASEREQPTLDRVAEYLGLVPPPDLVIYPCAPREVCEKRVVTRGVWERFQSKSPADLSRFIASSHAAVQFAVDCVTKKGWPLIEVDNGGDRPADAMRELELKLLDAHENILVQ